MSIEKAASLTELRIIPTYKWWKRSRERPSETNQGELKIAKGEEERRKPGTGADILKYCPSTK